MHHEKESTTRPFKVSAGTYEGMVGLVSVATEEQGREQAVLGRVSGVIHRPVPVDECYIRVDNAELHSCNYWDQVHVP